MGFLWTQRELPEDQRNYGYAVEMAARGPAKSLLGLAAPHLLEQTRRDTALWPALFAAFPDWHWGIQPTGDCTRWMQQHLLDTLNAVLWCAGKQRHPGAQVAGESIYALAKCELANSYRYHGAGATGWAVATASLKYGHLYRRNYEVNGRNWDLSRESTADYDGGYSIAWGDRGRGLPDELEPFAAQHRVADRIDVESTLQAGLLIQAGYPVQYCGRTSWATERDAEGLARELSTGMHAMCLTGVRWDGAGEPEAFWCANTGHGAHCSGPVGPIAVPEVYAECGGWLPAYLVARVIQAGDCHAHTVVDGWPILDLTTFAFRRTFG